MKRLSPLKLTALITVLIFIGLAIYPAMIWWEWEREQEYLISISPDGTDDWNYDTDGGPYILRAVPEAYEIHYEVCPSSFDEYLERIICISIESEKTTIDTLDETIHFNHLWQLGFRDRHITNMPLEILKYHTSLGGLDLSGTSMADDDLYYLRNLVSLKGLYISRNDISDEGLFLISNLRQIRTIDVSYNKITEEGFRRCMTNWLNLGMVYFHEGQVSQKFQNELRKSKIEVRFREHN